MVLGPGSTVLATVRACVGISVPITSVSVLGADAIVLATEGSVGAAVGINVPMILVSVLGPAPIELAGEGDAAVVKEKTAPFAAVETTKAGEGYDFLSESLSFVMALSVSPEADVLS